MATSKKVVPVSDSGATGRPRGKVVDLSAATQQVSDDTRQLKLKIDYKVLMLLLPLIIKLIGNITKKDDNNGQIEFQQNSGSGNVLSYILNAVAGKKKGETILNLTSANNSPQETSQLGNILGLLGNATTGQTGSQLLQMANSGQADDSNAVGGLLGNLLGGSGGGNLLGSLLGGGNSSGGGNMLGTVVDLLDGNNNNSGGGNMLGTVMDLLDGNDNQNSSGGNNSALGGVLDLLGDALGNK